MCSRPLKMDSKRSAATLVTEVLREGVVVVVLVAAMVVATSNGADTAAGVDDGVFGGKKVYGDHHRGASTTVDKVATLGGWLLVDAAARGTHAIGRDLTVK